MSLSRINSATQRLFLQTQPGILIATLALAAALAPLLSWLSYLAMQIPPALSGSNSLKIIVLFVGIAIFTTLPTLFVLRSPLGAKAAGIALIIWLTLRDFRPRDSLYMVFFPGWWTLIVFSLVVIAAFAGMAIPMRHFIRAQHTFFQMLLVIPYLIALGLAVWISSLAAIIYPFSHERYPQPAVHVSVPQ